MQLIACSSSMHAFNQAATGNRLALPTPPKKLDTPLVKLQKSRQKSVTKMAKYSIASNRHLVQNLPYRLLTKKSWS